MNNKNRLRTRVLDRLTPAQIAEARAAWDRVFDETKPKGIILNKRVQQARFAMLAALDEGKSIAEAEQVGREELARAMEK